MLILLLTLSLSAEPPIASGARPMEAPGRYDARRSYEDLLTYYERHVRHHGGMAWRSIINRPGIRAKHLKNLRTQDAWAGLNLYEWQGKSYIFVVPR